MQEAMAFVTTLERAMDRFVNAMLLLGKGYPLTAACQAVLVTHARRQTDSGRPVETVISRHPDWGMTVAGPASWSQVCRPPRGGGPIYLLLMPMLPSFSPQR